MKFAILLVLLILVAPTIAKYFSKEEAPPPRGGFMYRMARKYRFRTLAAVVILGLVAVSLLVYFLSRRV